ncbi:hypothetical protein PIROE2DRAFT_8286 [Piromyces sp. E2]|nr:hypothetical protein PIROE2DRAFT_8286 [Piromyces sp. E2]|eukprot:OUM64826.1 hypothetical protein PIROE2DRAFT_8286 [Piromyces sp. E2]
MPLKMRPSGTRFWDELDKELNNITNQSIKIYEDICTGNGYDTYLDKNIKEIKENRFHEMIRLLRKEINDNIENYLVSYFEEVNCRYYKVHNVLKKKEMAINEGIEFSQNIVNILSKSLPMD